MMNCQSPIFFLTNPFLMRSRLLRILSSVFGLLHFFFCGILRESLSPKSVHGRCVWKQWVHSAVTFDLCLSIHRSHAMFSWEPAAEKFSNLPTPALSWVPLKPGIGPYNYVIDTLIQHPVEKDHIYAGAWDLHLRGRRSL